jgi:hypothetical protein
MGSKTITEKCQMSGMVQPDARPFLNDAIPVPIMLNVCISALRVAVLTLSIYDRSESSDPE